MGYKRNKAIELIEGFEAEGRRTFTVEEAIQRLNSNRRNMLAILGNLKRAKRIISLTKSLYALWHPSERKWGLHPLPVLDALMRFRKSPYYVGLLSAADYYGAAHHKPQVLQVIIPQQIKLRKAKELALSSHVSKNFPSEGIISIKTPSGMVAFSSPELTTLDLFYFESVCGGFKNVSLVIRDLIPKLKSAELEKIINTYPYSSSVQKLGYLMEYFGADHKLQEILRKWAKRKGLANIALSSRLPKRGKIDALWRIVQNVTVEVEE